MKRLIFSDTHFTTRFDFKRFDLIASEIRKSDQVIIVGDLWDGYLITFEDFINSKWNKLFPLLKKKKTIYLTGNHDHRSYLDNRVKLFCDRCVDSYHFRVAQTDYYCEHSHELIKHIDGFLPFVRNKYFAIFSDRYFQGGTYLLKENFWKLGKSQNNRLLTYQANNLPNQIFISGHTHVQQYMAGKYLNPGIINYGLAQYIWLNDNHVKLVSRHY